MDKLKLHTPDLTATNIEKLASLFPNCVTEAKADSGQLKRAIDFDLLRQELSDHIVDGPRERYHLDWPGKREALLAANAPIAKTLRPCREESVNFDTTRNLFIEGDNLDALKLLQETYLGRVNVIYIDPPYNTGEDFVYRDNFASDSPSYLRESNQVDDSAARLVVNPESNGRFHSEWVSMMYARLKLARNLLRDEGVVFISIDDNEVRNVRKRLADLIGPDIFDFPKDEFVIRGFIEMATTGAGAEPIILDFFAGSGTTAHATFLANVESGNRARFILVQLPELCREGSEAAKKGFRTIADISRKRIIEAGKKVKTDSGITVQQMDTGFRVLKIDTSNMKDVYYAPDSVEQTDLALHTDNIKEDRASEDLLFQVLVDWGVDLALPIEKQTISGHTVYFVDGNSLAACFDSGVGEDLVKELAKRKPLRAVFRDSSFAGDSVKINVEQIFKLLSPDTEVKSL